MKYYKYICLSSVLVLAACSGIKNEIGNTGVTACAQGTATDGKPCTVSTGQYVYSDAYGGRSDEVTNYTGPDGVLSFFAPSGWYSGATTISLTDTNLVETNIASGVTIFGVTGSLTGGAYAPCTADSLNASACTAAASSYVYNTEYGGRGAACNTISDPAILVSSCWLTVAGKYIYTTGEVVQDCSVQGAVSPRCNVTAGNYWYTTAYNGRGTNCTNVDTGTTNGAACWVSNTGATIYTGSNCATTGINADSCQALAGNYVYSTAYGGRDVSCARDNSGDCYMNAANKSLIETNLVAAKIKTGVTIFGVLGTNTGVTTNWGSGMHRDQATTASILLSDEVGAYAGTNALPAGYHPVPKTTDNDGKTVGAQVVPVDRTGWGGHNLRNHPKYN